MTVDTLTRELLMRADANYREMFRTMARISPVGVIEEDADVLLVYTGSDLPLCNAAIVKRATAEPLAIIERARAFFGRFGQGMAVIPTAAFTTQFAEAATAAGLHPDGSPG